MNTGQELSISYLIRRAQNRFPESRNAIRRCYKRIKIKAKNSSRALYGVFSMLKNDKRQIEEKQNKTKEQKQTPPSFQRKSGRKISQRTDAFRKHDWLYVLLRDKSENL